MSDAARNPFDDPDGTFLVLENARREWSLWPDFALIPDGWSRIVGPETLAACTAHIDATRKNAPRPASPPNAYPEEH